MVIPAHNEAHRLGPTLARIHRDFESRNFQYEIIVVDDASTDGTAGVARSFAAVVPECRVVSNGPQHGKGCAVREGMLAAQGEYVFFSDADLSTPLKELDMLLCALQSGCDIAFASRLFPGSSRLVRGPWIRSLLRRIFAFFVRFFLPGIYDSQCGFKGFTREAARRVASRQVTKGFAFDVELLTIARLQGLRLREIPVTWTYIPGSRINLFTAPCAMMIEIAVIFWNRSCGRYSR